MQKLIWLFIALLGASSMGVLALHRGETVSAAWMVIAALCCHLVAYRFYSKFLAGKILKLDDSRHTPAHEKNDGMDFVPTSKAVLFGHHFAAIAGAGPLMGPVLAAQLGYLPGTLWILAGAVFCGAVQDFTVLVISSRRGARSLPEMIKDEMGKPAGLCCGIGIMGIVVVLLAVLAFVVTNALAESPWATFTVLATIPIALLMGLWTRFFRPGAVLEATALGILLLLASIIFGGKLEGLGWSHYFLFSKTQIAWGLIVYGALASILPVWLLLAPRDYLSTFLKLGVIVLLGLGILISLPDLHMPAISKFIDGSGPVFAGNLFPFMFITIACGAVSGFHALVASGTTPKLLDQESHARPIGYGAMLCESGVAIMAMICACMLQPGLYFAVNTPAAVLGPDAVAACAKITEWGFSITPAELQAATKAIGEPSLLSKVGGAPTFALGTAFILDKAIGGGAAFWYHFAILFEALFILTTIDAGTRVARFLAQDLLGRVHPALGNTGSWPANILATLLVVAGWGWFLLHGLADPFGGVKALWPMFGIANQILAAIALLFCTVVLYRQNGWKTAWVTGLPFLLVATCTMTAAIQKLFHSSWKIGFYADTERLGAAIGEGKLLPGYKNLEQMSAALRNTWINLSIDAGLVLLFVATVIFALRAMMRKA